MSPNLRSMFSNLALSFVVPSQLDECPTILFHPIFIGPLAYLLVWKLIALNLTIPTAWIFCMNRHSVAVYFYSVLPQQVIQETSPSSYHHDQTKSEEEKSLEFTKFVSIKASA